MSKPQFDVMMRTYVSAEQKRQLEELALIDQSSISTIVRKAIREFLARSYNQDRPEPDPGPGPTNPPPPPTSQLQLEAAVG